MDFYSRVVIHKTYIDTERDLSYVYILDILVTTLRVNSTVKQMEKSELFEISRKNNEWLRKNYAQLKREYDKRWVIIHDRKVVGSASTFDEIMRTVRRHDPNRILVEYIQSEPIAMFF